VHSGSSTFTLVDINKVATEQTIMLFARGRCDPRHLRKIQFEAQLRRRQIWQLNSRTTELSVCKTGSPGGNGFQTFPRASI
jgi:hypothetical protein